MYSTANMARSAAFEIELQSSKPIPMEVAQRIDADLVEWFLEYQRPLKFRETTDPYDIMVSEFMLQQTTVASVEPYFARFITRFPEVASLAKATEDEVMSLWAGLGYYRRARQLRASAVILTENYGGRFPKEPAELQKLPGFGRYTAGAVISQAFDLPAAILETNTVRVFARLAGIGGMIGDSKFMKALWIIAEVLVCAAKSPRTFNRAAMELGALICRPLPLCPECPVQQHCVAYKSGTAATLVQIRPRRQNVPVEVLTLAMRNEHARYGVRRIPKGEWHDGMWEFPTERITSGVASFTDAKTFAAIVHDRDIECARLLTTLRYQVTHHKIICNVFHCETENLVSEKANNDTGVQFLDLKEISTLPMGSAQKKICMLLIDLNDSENL